MISFIVLGVIILIITLWPIIDKIKNPKRDLIIKKEDESLNRLFKEVENLKDKFEILKNTCLSDEFTEEQFDLVIIGESFVYTVDYKNGEGNIEADINSSYWKKISEGREYQFYNPIIRNKKKLENIRKIIGKKPETREFKAYIVFSDDVQKIEIDKSKLEKDIEIIKVRDFVEVLKNKS